MAGLRGAVAQRESRIFHRLSLCRRRSVASKMARGKRWQSMMCLLAAIVVTGREGSRRAREQGGNTVSRTQVDVGQKPFWRHVEFWSLFEIAA